MGNMLFDFADGVLVAVHNDKPPGSDEWREYIELTHSTVLDHTLVANLVYSEGGGPNAKQRGDIDRMEGLKPIPTIVMSTSVMARGVVTALGWLGKNIKACAPADAARLGEQVGMDKTRLHAVLVRIARQKMLLVGSTLEGEPSFELASLMVATPMAGLRSLGHGPRRN